MQNNNSTNTEKLNRETANVAKLSVLSNTILVVLKLIVGILIGSVSVISEAIHSALDLVAALIALFAVKQSSKPADEDHPFGHGKFENFSGTSEAILIFIAAGWIIYEAVHKFQTPKQIEEPGWGIALMLLSSIVNFLVSQRLFKISKKAHSVALEADAWHLRTDVYTSLGVMVGLSLIWIGNILFPSTNLQWIDPTAAIFVALLIIKAAYDLTKKAALDLFDVSMPKEELQIVHSVLKSYSSIYGIHHLRTRRAGKDRFIEFHLVVEGSTNVTDAHTLTDNITNEIKDKLTHSHVNIHVEPCDLSCRPACLSGCLIKNVK